VERSHVFNDGVAAAQAVRAISAGHEEAAAAILSAAGLDGLGNDGLEDLCTRFGVEASRLPHRGRPLSKKPCHQPQTSVIRACQTGTLPMTGVVALLGVARVAGTYLPDRPLALRYRP
jgi:hypothetical protein